MKLIKSLFAKRSAYRRVTSATDPLRIPNGCIGFLNLQGAAGVDALKRDQAVLSGRFKASHSSSQAVPKCAVLFVYCSLDDKGGIVGSPIRFHDLVKEAQAYIAVVATENDAAKYRDLLAPRNEWNANVAMVLDRQDDELALFFDALFERMFRGISMLVAWVELTTTKSKSETSKIPAMMMVAEAGHVTLGNV
jgi:hypothetical protein